MVAGRGVNAAYTHAVFKLMEEYLDLHDGINVVQISVGKYEEVNQWICENCSKHLQKCLMVLKR